jgi:hypothetical protein
MSTIISLWRTKLANRITTKFVLAATVLLLGSASVSADATCRTVNGHFNIMPVEDCPSPVGICGQGTFNGGIHGDYFSPFTSIIDPTVNNPPPDPGPGVVLYTADITVTDAQVGEWAGDLEFKEGGAFHTAGNGEFAALFSAVGGTGSFANANGVLSVTGMIDLATGVGEGVYSGQICVP